MDAQKYISKKTINAARLSRVVGGPCTDILQDVLRWRVPETDFARNLLVYEHSVKHCLSRPQRDMLYPQNGPCVAKYADFDISLLYVLLRNACNIIPHSKGWGNPPDLRDRSLSANIDRIREIRNKYCGHNPLTSLSDDEFTLICDEVRQIVQDLEFQIPGHSVVYVNVVDALKTAPIDPEQEKRFLEEIDRQKREDVETKKFIEQVMENAKQANIQIRSQIAGHWRMHKTMSTVIAVVLILILIIIGGDIWRRVKDVENKTNAALQQCQPDKVKAKQQAKILQEWYKEDANFFRTKACKEAEVRIQSSNVLTIVGNSGSGKTAIAQHIALRYHKKGYRVFYASSLDAIQNLMNPDDFFFINFLL